MLGDVKVTQPERPSAEPDSPARDEPSRGRNPVARTALSAQGFAGDPTASERCRACLGALAHRLAQPATALRGGMELALLGKRPASEYRSVLEQSLQLADHMVQLIVSLRDLAESSAPPGPPESVALHQTVREVQAEVQCLAESRDIHLQLTTEDAANICVDPDRLRQALQSLFAWVIQSSAGAGMIETAISAPNGEAQMTLLPGRWDLQYFAARMLEDVANPGLLFSDAAKTGAIGWAINRRLVEGLGGKLEIVTEGPDTGCIRLSFPLAPAS